MCGIAGLVTPSGATADVEAAAACSELLRHRGPDDLGYLGFSATGTVRTGRTADVVRGAHVALIHRRLSILDLSPAGWQPMSTADGLCHLVYNGEVYNYRELRGELEAAGHRFTSKTDTEVLLAACATWGTAALTRLVGMFAFAFLDLGRRELILARDPFGIKPLYYSAGAHGLAFASEIPAVLRLTGAVPRANPRRLYHYLRFGITDHGSETLVEGVQQLEAAHVLRLSLDSPQPSAPIRYWDPRPERTLDLSLAEAAARLRELLVGSVDLHMRSDVALGAALSGGIDSSAVVMSMRHLAGPDLELHTVSYVAEDSTLNERPWAELVARTAGTNSHWVSPRPEDMVADLELLIAAQYEPVPSPSQYAQLCVFRAAAEAGLKVMLCGQGADELLGGYRYYLGGRLSSLLRRGRWGEAVRLWRSARRLPGSSRSELLSHLGSHILPRALHGAARAMVGRPLMPDWLDADWFEAREVISNPLPQSTGREGLREMLLATLARTSLPMLLRFDDRSSMAFSVESRVPFLTPEIARFVLALPEEHLIDGAATSKAVLRAALRGLVPDAVLDRRDKIGFATPTLQWMRPLAGLFEETLASEAARSIPVLRHSEALRELDGVMAGERRFDWHLWRWVNLIRWVDRCGVRFDG